MSELVIYCDGGSRGNPGPSACAFVVYLEDKIIHEEGFYLGETTNNVAEYNSVIKALLWYVSQVDLKVIESIKFYLDSELIVKQLNGIYKIKSKHLIPLAAKVKEIERFIKVKVYYSNVPRENNSESDRLVNQTLDAHSFKNSSITTSTVH